MEIRIKFSKEEAESFKNFMDGVKPDDLPEEAFMKQVFFYGCNAINTEMRQMMEQRKAELEEKQAALGMKGEEDSEVPLSQDSEESTDLSQESQSETNE